MAMSSVGNGRLTNVHWNVATARSMIMMTMHHSEARRSRRRKLASRPIELVIFHRQGLRWWLIIGMFCTLVETWCVISMCLHCTRMHARTHAHTHTHTHTNLLSVKLSLVAGKLYAVRVWMSALWLCSMKVACKDFILPTMMQLTGWKKWQWKHSWNENKWNGCGRDYWIVLKCEQLMECFVMQLCISISAHVLTLVFWLFYSWSSFVITLLLRPNLFHAQCMQCALYVTVCHLPLVTHHSFFIHRLLTADG